MSENTKDTSFVSHLTELRKRLLWSFVYIILIFIVCFYYASDLFYFLAKPLVNLLQTDKTMSQLRGRIHSFGDKKTPLVVIYHPAYLLRSPSQKYKAWEDLTLARQAISKV